MKRLSKYVYSPLARKIIDIMLREKMRDASILDLGCGPALLSIEIKKITPNVRIIGVDPSEDMLKIAKSFIEELKIRGLELKIGRAEDIPIPEKSADIVVSSENLYL